MKKLIIFLVFFLFTVTTHAADWTWTKPAGAKYVEIYLIGGGGGGDGRGGVAIVKSYR